MVPELLTPRLLLSEFKETDAPAIFAYASDARVAKFVTWDAHLTLEDSLGFLRFLAERQAREPGAFFAWALRDSTGRAIGSLSFSLLSAREGQIDYALGAAHWGQGLMSEAAGTVVRWAFATFPSLARIQARCLPENLGSRRVMEKIGMQLEGVTPAAMVVKGRAVDLVVYRVSR